MNNIKLKRRILNILPELIEKYGIKQPIKVMVYYEKRKYRLESKYGYKVKMSNVFTLKYGDEIKKFTLLYSIDFWNDSNYNELKGNLTHEFGHMLINQSSIYNNIVDKSSKDNYIAIEMICDSISIAKGYKKELLESKIYFTNKVFSNMDISKVINYNQILEDGLIIGLPNTIFNYIDGLNINKYDKK